MIVNDIIVGKRRNESLCHFEQWILTGRKFTLSVLSVIESGMKRKNDGNEKEWNCMTWREWGRR